MASIADVYVELLPVTGKIADGLRKALLGADDDVRKAAQRWKRIIDRELSGEKVEIDADTKKAEAKLKKLEKDHDTVELDVDVDTAAAEAKLDALTRDRKVHLDVDMASATAAMATEFSAAGVQAGVDFGDTFATTAARSISRGGLTAAIGAALVPVAVSAGLQLS